MGTVANFLEDWCSSDADKGSMYATEQGKLVRWINQAQLRFSDISECLRGTWQPTIGSTGSVALPSDFKREIKDRIKWTANRFLKQMDYTTANIYKTQFSDTYYYSIWGGYLYVWAQQAGSPEVPYIKQPTAITVATLSSADLEIPSQYHVYLMAYLDSMYARGQKDITSSVALMNQFEEGAKTAYMDTVRNVDPIPMMRGNFF